MILYIAKLGLESLSAFRTVVLQLKSGVILYQFISISAVLEASEAFQNWKKIKEAKKQQDTMRIEKKPPPYKYIKVSEIELNLV